MKLLQLFQGQNINPLRVRHGKSSLFTQDMLICAFPVMSKMRRSGVVNTHKTRSGEVMYKS